MLIFFGFIAIILLFAGINNKIPELGEAVQSDFIGDGKSAPFWAYAMGLIFIGSLGFIKELKPVSNMFLILVFIVLILSNRGLFANIRRDFLDG